MSLERQNAPDPLLGIMARVSALELAMFAICKTASDKDGLIAEIDRLSDSLQPELGAGPGTLAHFNEIKQFMAQYRQYAEIGKHLRPGE